MHAEACCLLRQVFPTSHTKCYGLPSLTRMRRATICMSQYSYSTSSSEDNLCTDERAGRSQPRHTLPQQTDLLDIYRGLVTTGRIRFDEDQIRVVMELRKLRKTLQDYTPSAFAPQYYLPQTLKEDRFSQDSADARHGGSKTSAPWYSAPSLGDEGSIKNMHAIMKLRSHSEELAELRTPKGLLLTGPPGCGKSFLIDLWLSTIPTPFKVRKHYNELVLEIYRGVWEESKQRTARLHAVPREAENTETPWTKAVRDRWRRLLNTGSLPSLWNPHVPWSRNSYSIDPPIPFVIAHRLVLEHWLLVFDELQLLDVSSAGLLSDVLSWFWRMGGVVVATSNKVPDDLYRNGVQRERLEPFVEALKARCPVLVMQGERDWRRKGNSSDKPSTWFTLSHSEEFELVVKSITAGISSCPRTFNVFGRQLIVPWTSGDACKFSFAQLCEESLGPADYLTIASQFKKVIITDIPVLQVSAKNQSRRFISLIDALYEAKCRIVALAESEPDGLFFPDYVQLSSTQDDLNNAAHEDQIMAEAISESHVVFRPNVSSYENSPERPAASPLSLDSLSIFSGEEERFAYRRALSRLIEMTSPEYDETEEWNPLPVNKRRWESLRSAAQPSKVEQMRFDDPQGGDFAPEAAFEFGSRLGSQKTKRERPSAPRLKEDHFWGVRDDWGPKAGAWGKGAKARREEDEEAAAAGRTDLDTGSSDDHDVDAKMRK